MRQLIGFIVLLATAPALASISSVIPPLAFSALVVWVLAGLTNYGRIVEGGE